MTMENLSKSVRSIIKTWFGRDNVPSFTSIHQTICMGELDVVMGWKPLYSNRELVPGTGFSRTDYLSEVSENILVLWTEIGSPDGYNSLDVTFVHPIRQDVEDIITKLNEVTTGDTEDEDNDENQFYLYRPSMNEGDLSLVPVDVPLTEKTPEDFFTDDFLLKIHKLSEVIKEEGKGMTLICGPKNTGKTTIITMLPGLTERTCVFIPNNMIDATFSNPLFHDILDEMMNPVLILDDTENHFRAELQSQNAIVNNILQLLEGPIDRNLHLVIVANDHIGRMDTNLTRSRTVKAILKTSTDTVKIDTKVHIQKGIRL